MTDYEVVTMEDGQLCYDFSTDATEEENGE